MLTLRRSTVDSVTVGLVPDGLMYVSSWVHESLDCRQLMETDDRALLEEGMAHWNDIVDFEVYPVITSKEAAEKIGPRR